MAKKSIYFCSECGYEVVGWMGKCPACSTWNSMVESEKLTKEKTKTSKNKLTESWLNDLDKDEDNCLYDLDNITTTDELRINSGIADLDHVLGGGFVKGSLVLVGGSPGMGKSTLLLQVCKNLKEKEKILYICGEESPSQIKMRASRLGIKGNGIQLLTETRFEKISEHIKKIKPTFVIVDSIQTLYLESLTAPPGTLTQVRDVSFGFLRIAKALNITICLVGHVTKDGQLAGPRVLEHMVDTVIYFDGDGNSNLRIIRTIKNRFGATDEIGIFAMTSQGLDTIINPSLTLLQGRPENTAGTVITAGVEGSRSYLLEIQALLSESNFASPQRMTQGVDRARLSMLIAVLEKVLHINLGQKDTYVNVIGGLKLNDTASDLAIVAALLSSFKNKPLIKDAIVLGELGLTGEVRPIQNIEKRITEAVLMGMKTIFIPGSLNENLKSNPKWEEIDFIFIDHLREFVDIAFS